MSNKLLALLKRAVGKPDRKEHLTTRDIGGWAEDRARDYLLRQGLNLRDRNYRCKAGEIDLIMADREALVFVEVRSRNNPGFGSALDSVTQHKQQRLIRAAKHYLQRKQLLEKLPCRFDVVSVGRNDEIEWIANAFTTNG